MRQALFLLTIGCTAPVIGNGTLTEQDRAVAPFASVETYGVNVRLVVGTSSSVIITTDANIQEHIALSVADGVLRIDGDDALYPTALTAQVTAPELRRVGHFDGADLSVTGLDAASLEVVAGGSGHTELLGAVDTLELIGSGSGVRNASELTAGSVTVTLSGSSTGWVTVLDSIEGETSSMAVLNVFGDPIRKAVTSQDTSEVIYH